MSTGPSEDNPFEEKEGNYVRTLQLHSEVLDQAWIHLVPRGHGVAPAQTYEADDCHIDLDADGNVMGVVITWNMRGLHELDELSGLHELDELDGDDQQPYLAYLAHCRACFDDRPMPFGRDEAARDEWAAAHSAATGHAIEKSVTDKRWGE